MFSLRLGHARGLTVHRTVIQDPRAAQKTHCVFLATSELFALRTHNPTVMWFNIHGKQKEKSTSKEVLFFFLIAEMGFEPHDLRVMSPTSYQAALLRDI